MSAPHDTPLDVVIVGGSQAGLAVAYYLKKRGLRFVLLDAEPEIGRVWKSRWDSLTLFTPAQYSGLPGMDFPAAHDVYPSKDDVAAYLQSYASAFDLPVRPNARVTSLAQERRRLPRDDQGRGLPGEPGRGGDRSVPGALCSSDGGGSGRLGRADPQCAVPKPGSAPGGAGARRGRRQLRLSDRRGARRDEEGRPRDGHAHAGAASAPARPRPVLVALPSRDHEGQRRLTARPADGQARRAHRLEQAATPARRRHDQGSAWNASKDSARRLRRREPAGRRNRDLGHRIPVRLLVDRRPRSH